MSLDEKHPEFADAHPDWVKADDGFQGERHIKGSLQLYLPATQVQQLNGARNSNVSGLVTTRKVEGGVADAEPVIAGIDTSDPGDGQAAYLAYVERAEFPEWVRSAITYFTGKMHDKPATIELPPQLEYLRERATRRGDDLETLHRRLTHWQMRLGRVGLMGDVFGTASIRPGEVYISLVRGDRIINWDEGENDKVDSDSLNLVVLDESGYRRDGLTWRHKDRFRVLSLGDLNENEAEQRTSQFMFAVADETRDLTGAQFLAPRTTQAATEIPFVFCNVTHLGADIERPPLLPLVNKAISSYRSSADYEQALFMQGQDTLVVIGNSTRNEQGPWRTGSGNSIELTQGSDAKFIGVSGSGLPEQRQALENKERQAMALAGQLAEKAQQESGESLRLRSGNRAATAVDMAKTSAAALQAMLRKMARWVGADPDAVIVTPYLDFAEGDIRPEDILTLQKAKNEGAPLSSKSIHTKARAGGWTDNEYDDELTEMEEEEPVETPPSSNPNGPGDDPDPPQDPPAPAPPGDE